MEVTEKEIKYVLQLLDNLDEEIYDEILHMYYDEAERRPSKSFTPKVVNFFKTNLKSNPVTCTYILHYWQSILDPSDPKLEVIQKMYVEVLKDVAENSENIENVITMISLIRFENNYTSETVEGVLSKISDEVYKQCRKQIYISLVAHDRVDLMETFSNYLKKAEGSKEFELTPENMLEMCYLENQHWILKALQVYKQNLLDIRTITFKLNNFRKQVLILALIEIINNQETYDLPSVVCQLNNIFALLSSFVSNDKQLEYYVTEIYRELNVIKFCMECNCKLLSMNMFNQVLIQSALSVVSQMCRLAKIDRYKVTRLLNSNNGFLKKLNQLSGKSETSQSSWDLVAYNSYCAVTAIIDLIVNSVNNGNVEECSNLIGEVKHMINACPKESRFEIVENIYACLFLRYEYFSCDDHNHNATWGAHSDCSYFDTKKPKSFKNIYSNSGFMCNSDTMQLILTTLQECLKNMEDSESFHNEKYDSLVKTIEHSLWKLQLVSYLTPEHAVSIPKICVDYKNDANSSEEDVFAEHGNATKARRRTRPKRRNTLVISDSDQLMTSSAMSNTSEVAPQKTNVEFVSLMLATPSSLVALALHHNNFNRANQIIQMFDLADADIALEVKFTEQLRHLVSRIKTINTYEEQVKPTIGDMPSFSVLSTEVTSMVEGFLSINQSPNSHEIAELARRHPHLQLYDQNNGQLINVIDILISTAIKREVTYGLINVIERKLTDVDVLIESAPKKSNYINFIKDLTSIMFEILSSTSNNYPDNICGVVTDCKIPLKHKDFVKINQYSKELDKHYAELKTAVSSSCHADIEKSILQKYHQVYMNVVTIADKDVCNIADIAGSKKSRIPYLRTCYIYCKNVSNLEPETENTTAENVSDTTYFSVLDKHLHDVIGDLVFEKKCPISSLEPICKKMNINLVHKLLLNFCPVISLKGNTAANELTFNNLLQIVFDSKLKEEELFIEPSANFASLPRAPDSQSSTYILIHNWILANVLRKLHSETVESVLQTSVDTRTKVLNNYMELERFDFLKILYSGNKYLSSLHSNVNLEMLFEFMPKLIETGKFLKCLNILDALPEQQLLQNANLQNLRDLILFKLSIHPRIEENWRYSLHIKCSELAISLALNNLNCWPAEGAVKVLNYVKYLFDQDSEEDLNRKCTEWLQRIPIYEEITTIIPKTSWYEIHEKSLDCPEEIIEILMENQQFKLCLDWADMHEVTLNMKNLVISHLLKQMFEYPSQSTPEIIDKLLKRLPAQQALDVVKEDISKIKNIEILQVVTNFVNENSSDWNNFENIKIGLLIIKEIELKARALFWDIVEKPLLMIEQLLMNGKIEKLKVILDIINPHLKYDPVGDQLYYNIKAIDKIVISKNAVDACLRLYAEKALDLKSHRIQKIAPMKPADESLLQSIDSINIEASMGPFVMPEKVPPKTEWTKDYSVDSCMVCKVAIFSLIIRRHHCRRCGRVVCHACSRNRMTIPSYAEGVKFRICDDCHSQTLKKVSNSEIDPNVLNSSQSESMGSGSSVLDWCLTVNSKRNQEIRNEFSYEFTPNVNLCLTIMKLHSINLDYPKFLLDRSEEVWSALGGATTGGAGAARLLVRARRWLLLAAAELYARPQQYSGAGQSNLAESGAARTARLLAHAAVSASLVVHYRLLPPHAAPPEHFVRHLLEAEKWELALEVATKSGVPRTGVLAAWGKTCLKAGCYKTAREKFAHCFKTALQQSSYIPESIEDCEYGREASELSPMGRTIHRFRQSDRSNSTSSIQSDSLRAKINPPLLNEIISILQDINYPVNPNILDKAEKIQTTNEKLASTNVNKKKLPLLEPALNVMHALATVNKIKNGDFSDFSFPVQPQKKAMNLLRRTISQNETSKNECSQLDPFFYKECIYYLSNYGSHAANIQFYLKHSSLLEVLRYCYDSFVEKEVFIESVYLECLKSNKVNEMVKCMNKLDSTLEMWTDYLTATCRWLQNNNRVEQLYALQCATSQHARAFASAARLYARPATSFSVLNSRAHLLAAARAHLMQCAPCDVARISNHKSLHLQLDKVTIDEQQSTVTRQIELASFLARCEENGRLNENIVKQVMPVNGNDTSPEKDKRILTLFGSNTDRMRLAAVCLAAGESIEEGFQLAYKIIKDYKLDAMKVFSNVARYLVQVDRFMDVKAMCKLVRSAEGTAVSDRVLEVGVNSVVTNFESHGRLYDEVAELLIEDVHSISIKISCYIECKILKAAYILAAKHERTNELKKILREAERLGQEQVRNACVKRLTR